MAPSVGYCLEKKKKDQEEKQNVWKYFSFWSPYIQIIACYTQKIYFCPSQALYKLLQLFCHHYCLTLY